MELLPALLHEPCRGGGGEPVTILFFGVAHQLPESLPETVHHCFTFKRLVVQVDSFECRVVSAVVRGFCGRVVAVDVFV